MNPVARALSLYPWDQFSTLTYGGNSGKNVERVPSWGDRRSMLLQWWRLIADSYGIPWDVFPAAGREEAGEKNGRLHWHCLIGGLHHVPGRGVIPSPNPKADKFRLINLWSGHCGASAGIADSRPYDARLSGAEYILKGLENLNFSSYAANAYELSKFDDSREGRELIVTPFVYRYLARRSRNRRHQKARDVNKRSRDRSSPGASKGVPSPTRFPHPHDPTNR